MSDQEYEVVEGDFCGPERPKDACHWDNVTFNGVPIGRMKSAHVYFDVINWINLFAPTGYWAAWAMLKVDPVNNIVPIITEVTDLMTSVTDMLALVAITDGDYDADGDTDADDQTYFEDTMGDFTAQVDALIVSATDILALFSWPILAGLVIASFNSLASYWVIAKFKSSRKAHTKPSRMGAYWEHVKIFMWQNLVFGGASVALAFLDTTSLGADEFNMTGNGLVFIIMAGVYGVTTLFNFIFYKTERMWFYAQLSYGAQTWGADERFSLGGETEAADDDTQEWDIGNCDSYIDDADYEACLVAEAAANSLFTDADWSW